MHVAIVAYTVIFAGEKFPFYSISLIIQSEGTVTHGWKSLAGSRGGSGPMSHATLSSNQSSRYVRSESSDWLSAPGFRPCVTLPLQFTLAT